MPLVPVRRRGEVVAHAIVDEADLPLVESHRWSLHAKGYAYRSQRDAGSILSVLMHRSILGLTPGDGMQADHRDGNRLNNVRSNLRVVTNLENGQNLDPLGGRGASRHRGVSITRRGGRIRWRAVHHGPRRKAYYIGTFRTEEEAAEAARAWRLAHYTHNDRDREPAD
jgi:hypothetical protein